MHAFKRTKLQNTVIFKARKIDKRMYLQMHLFGVMFHSGPVRGPPEIKVIFTGINPTSVLEIRAEDACQGLVRAIFLQQYWTNPVINHTGV